MRLLIVHHSPTAKVQALADAAIAGANEAGAALDIEVVVKQALEATADDLLAADGYLLGTTANFGYISGALKHFFDSTFMQVKDETVGRPFSYWIRGGMDTTGAEKAMESITTGYKWRSVAEPLVFVGDVDEQRLSQAEELGGNVCAALAL